MRTHSDTQITAREVAAADIDIAFFRRFCHASRACRYPVPVYLRQRHGHEHIARHRRHCRDVGKAHHQRPVAHHCRRHINREVNTTDKCIDAGDNLVVRRDIYDSTVVARPNTHPAPLSARADDTDDVVY